MKNIVFSVITWAFFSFHHSTFGWPKLNLPGTISSESLDAASSCLDSCKVDWAYQLEQAYQAEAGVSNVTLLALPFTDLISIQRICRAFHNTTTCIGQCPSSKEKQMWLVEGTAFRYLCNVSDYAKHAACLNQVRNSTEGECSQGMCNDEKTDPNDKLQRQCSLRKCGLDCMKSVIIDKCGQGAYDTMETLIIIMVTHSKAQSPGPALYNSPRPCDQLISHQRSSNSYKYHMFVNYRMVLGYDTCLLDLQLNGEETFPIEKNGTLWCNATWDSVLCWPAIPANTSYSLPCPPLKGLDTSKNVTKHCHWSGRWMGKTEDDFSNPSGWTDYISCINDGILQLTSADKRPTSE